MNQILGLWTGSGYELLTKAETMSVPQCASGSQRMWFHAWVLSVRPSGVPWGSAGLPIDGSKQLLRYPRTESLRCGRLSVSFPAVEGVKERIFSSSVAQDEIPSKTKKWQRWSPKWSAYFTMVRIIHQPACKTANAHIRTPKFVPHSHLQVESPLGWRGSYASDQNSNVQLVSKQDLSVQKKIKTN